MSIAAAIAILGVGLAAGTLNTIVGSGSLITFPTLLALGYPPVVANVSNTVGLVTGSISGAIGYRRELEGQRPRLRILGTASLAGGLTGGLLLLALPASMFRSVVPVLILVACVLVAIQPRLARRMTAGERPVRAHGGPLLLVAVFLTGVYGGYFGAAQGVMLIALLGIFLDDTLQRLNAAKNVLAALVNGIAAVLFMLFADVDWAVAGLLAVGAIVGGQVGATLGRRISPGWLRAVIVVVGVAVAIRLLVR
ncbi:MAG TPA: sulfite exporter TauE/SafE family protein [Acidimicrobiales bacterium]|nr:sulfite exporter TauE/SafE family protein [Acidimicrobiales bacterium]